MSDLSVYEHYRAGRERCYYCGRLTIEGYDRNTDHFWPKSKGGRVKVVCCIGCNALKSNMTPPEFIQFLRKLKSEQMKRGECSYPFDRMINATVTLWDRMKHTT